LFEGAVTLHTYLPQDRLRALACGQTLPDRTTGAALFADISGFTALTESLRDALGPRQGAEELTRHLGAVYSALIAEVEKYDGSVISFAGDAVICWFDGGEAAMSAVPCAFGLQAAMQAFSAIALPDGKSACLSLKVCVATGAARRFVVGDPDINYIDALAGATVARTATGEHLTGKGEILVDEATAMALGESLAAEAWRVADSGERFAVARAMNRRAQITRGPDVQVPEPVQLKPWIDKSVYERERSGQGSFLTEFRPGAVLFVNFAGIDYDADEAQARLDSFVRQLQKTAARYGGAVLQINIGDKGSYAYVNFGALSAHEDDARRAVKTALDLRQATDLPLRMGIAQGVMRVGAYGGGTRRTYGALGDDVNLAARLMTTAGPGEILVSGPVHKAVEGSFSAEPRPPLPMKGKAEPLPVFAVTGERKRRAVRLQEPSYHLPMVGRVAELELVQAKLDLAAGGKGQVIGIVAEAGMGKSRLVAEIVRSARRKGFVGYGGACQSDAIHTPYQGWKSVWQAFFDIDPEQSARKQIRLLEGEIEDRAPTRTDAMPLLNVVLDLQIPENDFTEPLEPKVRQSALHALLEECLKAADEPTLIVIEDLHWVDALSQELLEQLAGALASHPVAFVLAYRPGPADSSLGARLEALPQFTRIDLSELTRDEAEQAIRAKLAQLYPARGGALPPGLVEALMARAQGNPFYIEELLNYVRDRGLDPTELAVIELPDSLHALILSRIDQLSEREKSTLRVASVVGRLFRAQWLTGCYPELGAPSAVKSSLDALSELDITPLDSPEPELRYLFKHIVTQEVTYESLPFATRSRLHEQLATYLESIDAPVEAIAFHYGRTLNKAKQIEFLRKAGEAAQRNYANESALEHFSALLPLLEEDAQKRSIHLLRGEVAELMGRYEDADSDYRAALACAGGDLASQADVLLALGKLCRMRGDYGPALDWLSKAHEASARAQDLRGQARASMEKGLILVRTGDHGGARAILDESLAQARAAGDQPGIAFALNTLGHLAWSHANYVEARDQFDASLALRREIGDWAGIASSLSNLGAVALTRDEYGAASPLMEEGLAIRRRIGDKWGVAMSLGNLGVLPLWQGDYATARAMFEETLAMRRELGDKPGVAQSLYNLSDVSLGLCEWAQARAYCGDALALYRELGEIHQVPNLLCDLGVVELAEGRPEAARALFEESLAMAREADHKGNAIYALVDLGLVDLAEGKPQARERLSESLLLGATDRRQATTCLVACAALALDEGHPAHAARLLGAVHAVLAPLGLAVEPQMAFLHKDLRAKVEAALGETAFAAAWDEGTRWPPAEAAERALLEA